MKTFFALGLCVAAAAVAHATPYTFTPSDNDLGDLDHKNTYIWGISSAGLKSQLASGYSITSATITITDLYNWDTADTNNKLFINLLGNPKTGLNIVQDDPGDNGINQGIVSNYFAGNIASNNGVYYNRTASLLTYYHDDNGPTSHITFTYSFSATQRSLLTSYITAATASGDADFGLGFDPDCHFYNTNVCLTVTTTQNSVPEGGATIALVGLGLLGLVTARRHLRR